MLTLLLLIQRDFVDDEEAFEDFGGDAELGWRDLN
jgi:hypothetical protein